MNIKKLNENFAKIFYRFGILKLIITFFLVLNIIVNFNNASKVIYFENGFWSIILFLVQSFQTVIIISSFIMFFFNLSREKESLMSYLLISFVPLILVLEKKGMEFLGEGISLVENGDLAYTMRILETIFLNTIIAIIFLSSSNSIFKRRKIKEKNEKRKKEYDWFLKENVKDEENLVNLENEVNQFLNKKIAEKKIINLNKELGEWKKLLELGEIDEKTYELEKNKILSKIERAEKKSKIIMIQNWILFGATCIVMISTLFLNNAGIEKEYEILDSFDNIPAPVQINKTSQEGIIKRIDDTDVYIKFLAQYSISGRVESTLHFLEDDMDHKINPVDLGISWGFLSNLQNVNKLTFLHAYGYTLFLKINDKNFYKGYGFNQINQSMSNNHLTPSDDTIKKQLKAIKVGDYVKLEGYLMMSQYEYETKYGTNQMYRGSSTSRTDVGDGACESIYVTSVKWLKEN